MSEEKKPFRKLTYRTAVIAACRQCAYTAKNVAECENDFCALWHFRLGKTPKKPVNALELRVFRDDPNSAIFRARKGSNEDDEDGIIVTRKEYPAYIEDDEGDVEETDE